MIQRHGKLRVGDIDAAVIELVTCIAVGSLVGVAGGVWLLFNIVWIYKAMEKGRNGIVPQISSILTLPAFVGGGPWVTEKLIPVKDLTDYTALYFAPAVFIIVIINIWPCFRLIVSVSSMMDEKQ
jgi:uncharacterized membrane protein